MIVSVENNKIKKIKFGDNIPDKNEFWVPNEWGTVEIEEYIINGRKEVSNTTIVNLENRVSLIEIT